jgi:hypothetical protein
VNPAPTYIVEFAKNILNFVPKKDKKENGAFAHVLLCVYTGVPLNQILKAAAVCKSHAWIKRRTRTGEEVSIDVEIPFELLYICNRHQINLPEALMTKTTKDDVQSILNKLTAPGWQKLSIEELPSLFRMMCGKSPALRRAMSHRLTKFSCELSTTFLPVANHSERILRSISLSSLTGKRLI